MLDVSLLGGLRLRWNGKDVRFAARPKVAPLLAYLLLNGERPISRDSAAFALWPDESEVSARANLRRHLQYLRDALPDAGVPWVVSDTKTMRWNRDAATRVDAVEFERCAADRNRANEAVESYAELLPGCADEWIVGVRERLHAAYVSALWTLALESRGRRDLPAAAGYLQRILADDPWREDAVRALMAVRCNGGDRSSALQLCAQFEDRLKREMAVSLMPETVALRRAIENGEPLPTVPAGEPRETGAPAELTFRGRDDALARLRDAWERTARGTGGCALVVGEAGIGKSRLASEFALLVERRGGRVFWGTTSSPERYPYQAVIEALRSALSFVDPSEFDPRDRAVLARVLPRLAATADAPQTPVESERSELFRGMSALFAQAAARGPALVVLDDVHRAGEATVALLEHLFAGSPEHRSLFLATARDADEGSDATPARLRRLDAGRKPTVIALDRLNATDAVAIAANALPSGDAAAARRIAETSRGHPLFLTELVYAAEESSGTTPPETLPVRLRDAVKERISRLTPPAGLLLHVAAVVGTAFDLDVAAEVAGHSEAQFGEAADELVARRAIREAADGSRFEFEFAHDVFASVAYESIPEHRRRRWHRRTARASQRRYASRLPKLAAFVARHFDLGGEPQLAAQHYLLAARDARSAFADAEALAYARRGLELHSAPDALHFDLLALTENVYENLADRNGQLSVLEALERLCALLDDTERTRDVVRRQESLHRYLGRWKKAAEEIAQLERLSAGNARWTAIALGDRALLEYHRSLPSDAYRTILQAREHADASGEAGVLVPTMAIQAQIAALLGRRQEALACVERVGSIASDSGSPALALTAAHCEVATFTFFQEWSNVVRSGVGLARLANRIGNRNQSASAHLMVGGACVNLLRVDQGRRHLREAIERYRGANLNGAVLAYNNLATLELQIGRFDRAEDVLTAMKMIVAGSASALAQKCVASTQCGLSLGRGEWAAAIALADELSGSIAREDPLIAGEALRSKASALRACGRTREAVSTLIDARDRLRQGAAADSVRRATADLALAFAWCGDPRAGELAAEVLTQRPGQSAVEASTLWATAQALHLLGRDEDAAEALTRAQSAFSMQRSRLRSAEDRLAYADLRENVGLVRAFSAGIWPDSVGRFGAVQPAAEKILELS